MKISAGRALARNLPCRAGVGMGGCWVVFWWLQIEVFGV